MLWNVETLQRFALRTPTESVGRVHDLLVGDMDWQVRYLVVDTGSWLFGRRVLIAASALGVPDMADRTIATDLDAERIRHSPPVDADKPVSRQQEEELHRWYGWIPYWPGIGAGAVGGIGPPMLGLGAAGPGGTGDVTDPPPAPQGDPHLRSVREVAGYTVTANDADIGSIDSFLVDSDSWRIRWIVVDTGTWLPGRKVVIAPDWVGGIDWAATRVTVAVSRAEVEGAPEYDPARHMPREAEARIFDWYGRSPYW